MFQVKPAIVFMALAFSSHLQAQSQQSNGLTASASVTELEFYAPLASNTFSRSSEAVASPSAERTRSSASGMVQPATYPDKLQVHPFSKIAVGLKVNTLGAGIEIATPLSRSLNARAAVNFADFNYAFSIDGIAYDTALRFQSGQMSVDWFPFHGGFHVSPGVMYFQNGLSGNASVPPGQPFQLSDTSYINSVDDPVYGTAGVTYGRKIAPTLTIGFSNIIPRNGSHFTVPFEIGAAYLGAAQMNIQLAGTACTKDGCFNAATDPDTQANLHREEESLNGELAKYKLYPLVSLGFAYRF